MVDSREAAVTAAPDQESPAHQAAVILTPNQRVRVFISSTLSKPAGSEARPFHPIRGVTLGPA
jgi:hypothetical protein